MKKGSAALLLFILAGLFGPSMLQAQKGLKLGIFALPQNTWLYNPDDASAARDEYDYKVTMGMAAGAVVGYNFTENLGVRANFIYSLQGQRYENKNADRDIVTHNTRLHYAKVPIMIGFNTNTRTSKVIFSMYAGFQAGMLLKGRYYNDDQSYVPDFDLNPNIIDYPDTYYQYDFIDYGPVAEIGFDLKLTYQFMANIRIRGDYSLADAEDKNVTYTELQNGIPTKQLFWPESRSMTQNITGGILFGITYTLGEN